MAIIRYILKGHFQMFKAKPWKTTMNHNNEDDNNNNEKIENTQKIEKTKYTKK